MSPVRASTSGFALVGTLWLVLGLTALAFLTAGVARESVATVRNRGNATRAEWLARGCAAALLSEINAALARAESANVWEDAWRSLDDVVALRGATVGAECQVDLCPVGLLVDVNSVGRDGLRRALDAMGAGPAADSLADAILDWRDPDDEPRRLGAEEPWYRRRERWGPRNESFASVKEIRLVRGAEGLAGLDTLLGVEPGRILITRAPLAVLAALPGMSPELLWALEAARRERPPTTIHELAQRLPPLLADSLRALAPTLVSLATFAPDAWLLRVEASVGSPPVRSYLEMRVQPAGGWAVPAWQRRGP